MNSIILLYLAITWLISIGMAYRDTKENGKDPTNLLIVILAPVLMPIMFGMYLYEK